MNLKNYSFNYAKKYKSICKYLAIALPLLLLLIACIFPTKQINNTYALEETTTSEISSINFNQYIQNGNFEENNAGSFEYTTTRLDYLVNNNMLYIYPSNNATNDNFLQFNFSNYASLNDTILVKFKALAYANGINLAMIYKGNASPSSYYSVIYSTSTSLTDYYLRFQILDTNLLLFRLQCNIQDTSLYNAYTDIQFFNLTRMYGYGNEPTTEEFNRLFPNSYYDYQDNTLMLIESINNTYNQETLTQVNETKQPNENIIQPLNLLYKANINSWYDTFLTAFELNYEDNNYMYYLVHYPLYILYVVLLDLLLDIILLVPCLLHRLVHKYKGDD